MRKEGVHLGLDFVCFLHIMDTIPKNEIRIKKGPMLTGGVVVEITLIGKSGHGSQPHLSIDVISACTDLIVQLHTIVSTKISSKELLNFSICQVNSGQAENSVPERATIKGVFRYYNKDIGNQCEQLIE